MSVSLREKLEAVKLSNFKFSSFQRHIGTPNEETGVRASYLEFALSEPLARVVASKTLFDPETNQRAHESKEEVTSVKCMLDTILKYENEFTFSETPEGLIDPANCAGSYSGDLFLDLSNKGDVWLTDVKFSKLAGDYRSNARKTRLMAALSKSK